MEVANLFNKWLVSGGKENVFRLYFGLTRGRLLDAKSTVAKILLLKTYQKN